MRALTDPRDGTIVQLVGDDGEFAVAAPLVWADVPDTAIPRLDVLQADGAVVRMGAVQLVTAARPGGAGAPQVAAALYVWNAGGGLPLHSHDDQGHAMNVLRGAVTVLRDGATESYVAGQSTSFAVGESHSITATADNTVVVNITDGAPSEAIERPAQELQAVPGGK